MAERYADEDVQFIGINSNRQDSLEEIGHYARECKIEFPLLKDPGNRVADEFGAVRTPEAFVLDEDRVVRYWGRIDDQFGVGYARGKKSASELTRAIDEVLAGKPVSTPGDRGGRLLHRPGARPRRRRARSPTPSTSRRSSTRIASAATARAKWRRSRSRPTTRSPAGATRSPK